MKTQLPHQCSAKDRLPTSCCGFTILEILVAVTVLGVLVVLLGSMISALTVHTKRADLNISIFQEARSGLNRMASTLGQATLNAYWDYDDASSPTRYLRSSELHFLVGRSGQPPFLGSAGTGNAVFFQVPLGRAANTTNFAGMAGLLNEVGYYVDYTNDPGPIGTVPRYRYRLMQAIRPTSDLEIYQNPSSDDWLSGLSALAQPIAENVIFLGVWPRLSESEDSNGNILSPNYLYNSRANATSDPQPITAHQLPPSVFITVVAIDESSAGRICISASTPNVITSTFMGLFENSNYTDFRDDLQIMESRLVNAGINFRVLSTDVQILSTKMK